MGFPNINQSPCEVIDPYQIVVMMQTVTLQRLPQLDSELHCPCRAPSHSIIGHTLTALLTHAEDVIHSWKSKQHMRSSIIASVQMQQLSYVMSEALLPLKPLVIVAVG